MRASYRSYKDDRSLTQQKFKEQNDTLTKTTTSFETIKLVDDSTLCSNWENSFPRWEGSYTTFWILPEVIYHTEENHME